jgi:hypothetical protein
MPGIVPAIAAGRDCLCGCCPSRPHVRLSAHQRAGVGRGGGRRRRTVAAENLRHWIAALRQPRQIGDAPSGLLVGVVAASCFDHQLAEAGRLDSPGRACRPRRAPTVPESGSLSELFRQSGGDRLPCEDLRHEAKRRCRAQAPSARPSATGAVRGARGWRRRRARSSGPFARSSAAGRRSAA